MRRTRMPRVCSICTHVDRVAIETALGRGTSLRSIASQWSVSKTALLRHRQRHGHPQAPAAQTMPAVATPAATPHTLAACAAALLECCRPEVQARYEAGAARLQEPLDRLVVTGLHGYGRHLDPCRPWRAAKPDCARGVGVGLPIACSAPMASRCGPAPQPAPRCHAGTRTDN